MATRSRSSRGEGCRARYRRTVTSVCDAAALLCRCAAVSALMATSPGASAQAATASCAAARLIQATPASAQTSLLQPFTDQARSDWHYTPRRRAGVAWRDMSSAQRAATNDLLRSALTENGLDKVRAVMALEIALRELETFGLSRDPENYAIAIFGEPNNASRPWGWRIEGHHLSLHWTLRGDDHVATLPQFFGANPARVPRDFGKAPRAGSRVLGEEEDRARALLVSLSAPQRAAAVFDARPYGDIVTRNTERARPPEAKGVAFIAMSIRCGAISTATGVATCSRNTTARPGRIIGTANDDGVRRLAAP